MDAVVAGVGKGKYKFLDVGFFYIMVMQSVLLYGSEKWVMSPRIGKMLGGFHHHMDSIFKLQQKKRRTYGTWDCPPLNEAMS